MEFDLTVQALDYRKANEIPCSRGLLMKLIQRFQLVKNSAEFYRTESSLPCSQKKTSAMRNPDQTLIFYSSTIILSVGRVAQSV